MKTVELPDGTLLVSYDRVRLSRSFAVVGVCATVALAGDLSGLWSVGRAGVAVAAAACWSVALVLSERARFVFDPASRTISWHRQWAWSNRSGCMTFSSVEDVFVQAPVGDSGIPSRRVTLKLTDGRQLPLTTGYSTDAGDRILALGGRIRQLLGVGAADTDASVTALAKGGLTLDAVRLRRQTVDVPLGRAVEDVRERRGRL